MARRSRRHRVTDAPPRGTTANARVEIARTAARLMAEENIHAFAEAKARAADRLGINTRQARPRNEEIEAELRAYQALFQADEQPVWLARMRRTALEAMDQLAEFEPRLAGAVLRGTAVEESEVTLHLFTDPPEGVATSLLDRGIPWELDCWIGRFGREREVELPLYRISPNGQPVRLIVFPPEGSREAPRSPVDGKPMARATRAQVAELVQAGEEKPGTTNEHE